MINIKIINVEMANINAVENWLRRNNIRADILTSADSRLGSDDLVIIPGACHSGRLANRLRKTGFSKLISDHSKSGGYVMGICAGMHVLFDEIEEGNTMGLQLLSGSVKSLGISNNGWHDVKITRTSDFDEWPKTRKRKIDSRIYMNHGYFAMCDPQIVRNSIDLCNVSIPNIIVKDRIIGVQGHPEKSQGFGREILSLLGINR